MPTEPGSRWDVFVSYARTDRAQVKPIVDNLRQHGLQVFMDESDIRGFNSLTSEIRSALSRSTILLAYYSTAYQTRLPCQWELTSAFQSGLDAGNPCQRIMVINPEFNTSHIDLPELRDSRPWRPPQHADEHKTLVGAICEHLETLTAPIGLTRPSAYPMPPGFIGRFRQIWWLHHKLSGLTETLGASPEAARAQLVGLPGIGKTSLAKAYMATLGRHFASVGWHTIEDLPDVNNGTTSGHLTIVDDLTHEHQRPIQSWLSTRRADEAILLISRQCLYIPTPTMWLRGLDTTSAAALLSTYRMPSAPADVRIARKLSRETGGHPQALHLIGQLWHHRGQHFSYRDAYRTWTRPHDDSAEAVAEKLVRLSDGYPADYRPHIRAAMPGPDSLDTVLLRASLLMRAPHSRAFLHRFAPEPEVVLAAERLCRSALIEEIQPGRLQIAPIVRRYLERHTPWDSFRTESHRRLSRIVEEYLSERSAENGEPMNQEPLTGMERDVAFDLMLELRTRIATERLPDGDGILREALQSLKAVVDFTRTAGRDLVKKPHTGRVETLLDRTRSTIREFLNTWHPALTDHESLRPADVGVVDHERTWPRAGDLRSELARLQETLRVVLRELEQLTGTSLDPPAARS